eukprot:983320-Amphidinium_carterae.1
MKRSVPTPWLLKIVSWLVVMGRPYMSFDDVRIYPTCVPSSKESPPVRTTVVQYTMFANIEMSFVIVCFFQEG